VLLGTLSRSPSGARIFVGEVADVPHLGRRVVAGIDLEPRVDADGVLPSLVGEVAVDLDGTGGAVDGEGRHVRLIGDRGGRADHRHGDQ
jgi:hypothetical protein